MTVNGSLNLLSGSLTQGADLSIAGNYVQTSGTFTDAAPLSHSFTVAGSFSVPYGEGAFHRYTGSGSSSSPYVVRDLYDLQAMRVI